MPTVPTVKCHRPKRTQTMAPYDLTVRPLNKKDVFAEPTAKASIDAEWTRLRRRNAWDESSVGEWPDVAAEARRDGAEVHMGILCGFVAE